MHLNRTIFATSVLLAAGCATAAPEARESQPGTPLPARLRQYEANRERCDSMLEREYTPALRSAGKEGVAYVWMYADERGIVSNVRIHESSGHAELDEIALRVARCRRLMPALHKGEPTPVWVSLPFTFRAR